MIKFEKVSYTQFEKDMHECGFDATPKLMREIYDNIKLPKRATKCSAGYDFFAPMPLIFANKISKKFPTGIRCKMDDNVVLLLFPRSGLGFKHRFSIDNTIGVIDADYYNAKNEGHIHSKMHFDNIATTWLDIPTGEAYMQGVFVNYLKTDDDETDGIRVGGFGSTNKN